MKKIAPTLVLGLLLTPAWAFAHPHHDRPDHDRDKDDGINASETITGGFAAAALIGVGGYLVLRRRRIRRTQA